MSDNRPRWWPQAPKFRVIRTAPPGGSARNLPCPCGSGEKAKKCSACGCVIKATHAIEMTEYYQRVEAIVKAHYIKWDDKMIEAVVDWQRLGEYYRTMAITPEEAADLLIKNCEHEVEQEQERLRKVQEERELDALRREALRQELEGGDPLPEHLRRPLSRRLNSSMMAAMALAMVGSYPRS